jgi:hypothetical protein
VGINATVVPPSPPPVNPAPPSGSAARKEAKQRQAATAKSEEGSAAEQTQQSGGDLADSRPSEMTRHQSAMTRRVPGRLAPSITAVAHREQPSAWSRDVLYASGLGLAALVLALGFTIVGPTPRRRSPVAPAPAWSRTHRRTRR